MQHVRENNSRLLYLFSHWMNEQPNVIGGAAVRAFAEETGWSPEESYAMLLAAEYEVEEDRDFLTHWIMPALKEEHIADYVNDPYYRTIRIPERKKGRWTLRRQVIPAFAPFVRDDMEKLPDGRVLNRIGFFREDFYYPAVLEGDREWMTLMPNETVSTMPAVRAAKGKVLTFGLGLGYFAFMASEKEEVTSVTVVERDASVIALFQEEILPQFPHKEKITVVERDAFEYAEEEMGKEGFDLVFADIWHDVGDGTPLYQRFKSLEHHSPNSRFIYWIQPTMDCYLDDSLWAE